MHYKQQGQANIAYFTGSGQSYVGRPNQPVESVCLQSRTGPHRTAMLHCKELKGFEIYFIDLKKVLPDHFIKAKVLLQYKLIPQGIPRLAYSLYIN